MNKNAWATSAALTFVGPAAIGACLGLSAGLEPVLTGLVVVPLIVVGTAAFMLPGLYISSAFAGVAPPAGEVLGATALSLRQVGLLLLGLAPALAFLVATSPGDTTRVVLSHVILFAGAMVGLRTFYRGLFGSTPGPRAMAVFGIWALLSLFLGWQLLDKAINLPAA